MSTSSRALATRQQAPALEPARPATSALPRRQRQPARGQPGNHTRAGPGLQPEEAPALAQAKRGAAPEAGRVGPQAGAPEPGAGLALEPPVAREQGPGGAGAVGGALPAPGDAYLAALEAPPSRMAAAWSASGDQASAALAREQKARDAELPDFTARLDGAGVKAVVTATPEKPTLQAPPVEVPSGLKPAPLTAPPPTPAPRVSDNTSASQKLVREVGQDSQALKEGGQGVLKGLKTQVPDLETSPGAPPEVPLTGGADPLRAVEAEQQGSEAAEQARLAASLAIVQGPGPAQVQPEVLEVPNRVPPSQPETLPGLEPVPEMAKVAAWNLDAEASAAFDDEARPRMAEHLAQARGQLEDQETQRTVERERAVADTRRQVDSANAEADAKQAQTVGETRDSILGEQRETLRQQKEAVDGLTRDAGAQREQVLATVDERVTADEQKIASDYQQAEQDAQVEQRQGEERARARKEETEREAAQDSNWWEQAVEFVTEAIDALAKAIDDILSEVQKAVGALLDKVKQGALALIEQSRQWINERLDQFGAWLKQAVTAVLGDLFPELTRKLNAFIDQRIEAAKNAVNALADALKQKVSALVEGLRGALNALIEGYRQGVKALATLAKALVSGDWSAVAELLLAGLLKVLGIDPGEFYAFIGKIRSSLGLIVDDPGAFVGNLVGAVMKGFGQFADRILEHLKSGLLQWLFGVVAEAGITLPKQFDLAGVFDLVMQVLGLTLSRLRAKAVKLIGEKNVERIEYIWEFLSEAVAGGLGGLWERAQEFLGNLWDMVVGAAQDWLVVTLVKKAVLKLVSLFNPAGAILQLLLTAWDVYLWLRDNAKRIGDLVVAVVESMAEIATGAIGKAANWIEQALAKLVPVAIHLLANILGLGGIGEKIQEVITRAQTTVDQAIDKLVLKVVGLFKPAKGKEQPAGVEEGPPATADLEAELEKPVTFKAGEKEHRLWVEVQGQSAVLMFASEPSHLESFLNRKDIKALEKDVDTQGHVKAARKLLQEADFDTEVVLKALAQHTSPPSEKKEEARREVQELVVHLAWILDELKEYKSDAPAVGTYSKLSGVKDYTPHHVPPKGLANWIYQQVMSIPKGIRDLAQVNPVVEAATEAKDEHDSKGLNLSSILLHANTHISKTGEAGLDAYRAHHGLKTAELVAAAMKEKGLIPIIKGGELLTDPEDIARQKAEVEEGGEDITAVGTVSTQFYLKELDAARTQVKVEQEGHVDAFLASVANVFCRAYYQSRSAVKVALAHSIGKDGPPDTHAAALMTLDEKAKATWLAIHPQMTRVTRF
ncbi:hypothetical protein [Myxococcus sp. RHSTA-1-4]|uniref:hypothetical protein n=1 Tax=Myxococcus sp. RHSTA-1-4 TaxID=2874601 RepID=UPI001CBAC919|nr:hypothetical protein [Myxococcus sp. RHSTA-1-4]MBZ4420170.1 hypothetical protein [Myxococcus sp. RHSTA-1-4]